MSLATARRGTALGLALTLAVAGTALADELKADADVLTGIQSSFNLGEVAPGAERTVDVDFVLGCKSSSHLTAGASLDIDEEFRDIPDDGELIVTPGEVTVPADWPADGVFCSDAESAATVTPATLDVTAPMTPGAGYAYTVFFVLSDGEATSNLIATTIYLDVVVPDGPVDTTGPQLQGMPGRHRDHDHGREHGRDLDRSHGNGRRRSRTDGRLHAAQRLRVRPRHDDGHLHGDRRHRQQHSSATFDVTVTLAAPTLHWHVGEAARRRRAGAHRPVRPEHPAEAHRDRRRPRAGPGRHRGALAARPVARGLHDDVRGHRDAGGGSVRLERRHVAAGPRHQRAGRRLHAAGRPGRRRDRRNRDRRARRRRQPASTKAKK